jgi:hypothetical protein
VRERDSERETVKDTERQRDIEGGGGSIYTRRVGVTCSFDA